MSTIKKPIETTPGTGRAPRFESSHTLKAMGIKTLRMRMVVVSLAYAAISILVVSAVIYLLFSGGPSGQFTNPLSFISIFGLLLFAVLAGLPFLLWSGFSKAIGCLARAMERTASEGEGDWTHPAEDGLGDLAQCLNHFMKQLNETRGRLNEALLSEEEQKQSLIYIKRALEHSDEAITIRDLVRDTIYHNRKQLDLYGYSAEELNVSNGLALLCKDPEIPSRVRESLKNGDPWSGETEMRTRSGETLWVELRANPVKDDSGKVVGWVGIHKDITEQKRDREELARLATFPEQNPNPVIEVNIEGHITYLNAAAKKHFPDLEESELKQPALEGLNAIAAKLREDEEGNYLREVEVNGAVYEQRVARVKQSNLTRIYMSDITERKRTMGELVRLATFPEQNPNPVIEMNFEGRVTYLNAAAKKRFPDLEAAALKHSALEGLDEVIDELITSDEESFFREVESSGAVYEQKVTCIMQSKLIRIYMSDVTERKKTEAAMSQSLNAFLKVASSVSDGDLTTRGIEGDGTLGEIARLTNKMLEDVGSMLVDVKHLGISLSSSAMEILAASEQMATGAQRQTAEIASISSAVEEMAASMTQVSRNAESSARAAKEALDMAGRGDEAVRDTSDAMAKIEVAVLHTSEKMRTLATRSSEISEIIELINDIASQTNLLSLNAAIEAAHAGEAGLGFSVVAEEIRKLAERSGRATKDVDKLIKAIQGETVEALAAMEDGMKEVRDGSMLANEAGRVLQNISDVVRQSANLVEEIHAASEEEAKVTQSLAIAMHTVSGIAIQTSAGAEETAQTMQGLVDLSERLNDAISRFKVKGDLPDAQIYRPINRSGFSDHAEPSSSV